MATVGDTGAPSTNTVYYDALLSTTLNAYAAGKSMFDNIFKESAFLAYLRMTDAVKKQDGGERIAVPFMYGDNSTIKTHGGYDVIDTTPQDGVTTAFFERAEMTMREKLNNDLLLGTVSGTTFVPDSSIGSGALGLLPLGYFLRKDNTTDPTTGGNVGNIAGATQSWWRHRTAVVNAVGIDTGNSFTVNVSTYAGLKAALRRMYNYCSRGSGGSPNCVVFDQVSFETYENSLDTNIRYTNTKMADMGFDTIKLRCATCIWDEVVPDVENGTAAITAGTAFFINTNFYHLFIDSQTDIITTPFVEPENH